MPTTNARSQTKHSPGSRSSPITITAKRLTYADSDRKVHYEGGVIARGADFTASSRTADAYLLATKSNNEAVRRFPLLEDWTVWSRREM